LKKEKPEEILQKNVVAFLRLYAERNNFIVFSVPNEGAGAGPTKLDRIRRMKKFKKMGLLAGVADLVIIHKSKVYFLELKSKTGRQEDSQKKFESNCAVVGATYAICRSLDDVRIIMAKWGIIKI